MQTDPLYLLPRACCQIPRLPEREREREREREKRLPFFHYYYSQSGKMLWIAASSLIYCPLLLTVSIRGVVVLLCPKKREAAFSSFPPPPPLLPAQSLNIVGCMESATLMELLATWRSASSHKEEVLKSIFFSSK